jgi:type II secretory pathway pseudopilin PulG
LIVIVILGILITLTIIALNPLVQIQKSQDAQRKEDVKQLNSALDTFYNDKNCYPQAVTVPQPTLPPPVSGTYWANPINTATIYMQKVPIDPSVASGWPNYAYVTDKTDNCPQWNVIFAKVTNAGNNTSGDNTQASTLCPLVNIDNCLPQGFNTPNSRYNYCVLSGSVNCSVIQALNVTDLNSVPPLGVSGSGGSVGNGGGPGGGGPTCLCVNAHWNLAGGGVCQRGDYGQGGNPGNSFYCTQDCSGQAAACP